MLILLLLFSLIRLLQGAPLETTYETADYLNLVDILEHRSTPTSSHFETREVNDIIVSCLATIFACTWTAIHPNIPGPYDCGWEILKRQVTTMVYALLAPEAITAWALRQYFGARWIVNDYNKNVAMVQPPRRSFIENIQHKVHVWFNRRSVPEPETTMMSWTNTHGFFLQMGGFLLCEDGKPIQTLTYGRMCVLVENKTLDAPNISEAEIQDRSKGDVLSKTIVVLQTTWFIVQCITRWSNTLPVTELEVVTLGFAMLNALTYALWWNKPQSIGIPVSLERKNVLIERPLSDQQGLQHDTHSSQNPYNTDRHQSGSTLVGTNSAGEQHVILPKKTFLSRQLTKLDWKTGWNVVWRAPYILVQATLRPLSRMMDFAWTKVDDGDLRVPMFFSAGADDEVVYVASSIIACLFGLVHLIPAWFFDFPSRPEMLLWWIFASVITIQPIMLGLWTKFTPKNFYGNSMIRRDRSPLAIIVLVGLPFYIIARIAILILAFLSLRSIPPRAFITMDWISFIPHL